MTTTQAIEEVFLSEDIEENEDLFIPMSEVAEGIGLSHESRLAEYLIWKNQ